ncbi:MAG: beta-lactamase family protein [Bacteroidetes bacterium]|nr:beta-lactamase family protein [Bacteroidota bacterium]
MSGFRSVFFSCGLQCIATVVIISCGLPQNRPAKGTHITVGSNSLQNDSIEKIRARLNTNEKAQRLDSLFKYMFLHGGFNGNILVAQQGQVIYKKSWGYANYETKDSLTLNSVFQMGSSSKPLTATAILILKEQGLIRLSQTIDEFFPDFPYKKITVKDLLTHRSGLANYMYFCDSFYCYKNIPLSNDELLKLMITNHPLPYFKPNRRFEYSNTNYALLVNIIEKVSGVSYADFMKQEIFKPLGMNNSRISITDTIDLNHNKTTGYEGNWKKYDIDYLDGVLGDKNIFTTVDDLFLFDQALYTVQLLKKETLDEAYSGTSHEYPGQRNYGYGWRLIDEKDGTKIVYHNGWWHGYNNVFYRRLKDKTTIIILSNKINRGIYHIEGILNILDGSGITGNIFDEEGRAVN